MHVPTALLAVLQRRSRRVAPVLLLVAPVATRWPAQTRARSVNKVHTVPESLTPSLRCALLGSMQMKQVNKWVRLRQWVNVCVCVCVCVKRRTLFLF